MLQPNDTTAPDGSRLGLMPRWVRGIALVAALLMAAQALTYSYMASGHAPQRGSIGTNRLVACGADRFCAVTRVRPASPADRAGVVPGDSMSLDRFWERYRNLPVGDPVGVTIRHAGADRHLLLTTEALPPFFATTYIVTGIVQAAVALIALLILARAGPRRTGLALGVALICYATPGNYPRLWQNDPHLFVPFLIALNLSIAAAPVMMLMALRSFRLDVIGAIPRWLDRLIVAAAIGSAIVLVWGLIVLLNVAPLFGVGDGLILLSIGWSVTSALAPLALLAGWKQVPADARTRYAFMWAAVAAISANAIIDPVIMLAGNDYVTMSWPVLFQLGALTLGAILFAYAILRHRVIDLGFAINRTIVYSTLSFFVLLAFGLVEWGTEKLLPLESHEASVVIDAGIALGLFLVFHRIHNWVEHGVERLFFNVWHLKQKALDRFVTQASYITRIDVLIERTVEALGNYADGAGVAIYRQDAQGYALAGGRLAGVAPLLDPNLPALLALRAERVTLHDALAGCSLLLPMTRRAEVTGFIAIGQKPSGDPYPTDEETLLADAAQRIGHDLHALRIEELESENATLTARLIGVAA